MTAEFVTFRVFHEEGTLAFFKSFLEKNNIQYIVENHSQRFDPSFAYNTFNKDYSVKTAPENFAKIYALEEKEAQLQIQNVPGDYHLFDYSAEDLEKIVAARDEWNAFDYLLAKKILKEKGIFVKHSEPETHLKKRITELKKVSDIQPVWLIIFYIVAFFGGFMAIIIGFYIKTARKSLPNGEVIARYTKGDILHGNILFFAGIFFLIFWISRGLFFFPFLHFSY